MAFYGGQSYTTFRGVNLKDNIVRFNNKGWTTTASILAYGGSTEVPYFQPTGVGLNLTTGYIRIAPAGGTIAGTLAILSAGIEADRAWKFPDKSGIFGITGTINVATTVGATGTVSSTAVVVPGIRTEDAIVCTLQGALTTAGVALVGAVPGNGSVTLYISNTSGATLNYIERVVAYTIAK